MRYVIYSIGFFITLLLIKPLGLIFAAILGIALSATINTFFIDKPASSEETIEIKHQLQIKVQKQQRQIHLLHRPLHMKCNKAG